MGKFLPGNPGKPKGAKHKRKIIKVEDFVRENNIDVPKIWWETIQAIQDPQKRADSLEKYYKFVGLPPKAEVDDVQDEPQDSADILSIVNDKK